MQKSFDFRHEPMSLFNKKTRSSSVNDKGLLPPPRSSHGQRPAELNIIFEKNRAAQQAKNFIKSNISYVNNLSENLNTKKALEKLPNKKVFDTDPNDTSIEESCAADKENVGFHPRPMRIK